MSKTKQFCETSSIFEVDNIKNEENPRDFLQKWKVECRADGLVPMRLPIFQFHLSKVLRLPRKSEARSYEVLHLSRKIILANLKIWCSKIQPFSGNQRPDLQTSLMNMLLVLRLPHEMHLSRSSSNVPRLPTFLKLPQNPHVLLTFGKVQNPLRLPHETTSERPKVARDRKFLTCLTPQTCFAPQRRDFFNISTSKSAPRLRCLVHFDFEMCFAQQRRALFEHLNFQKCSERGVLCTFWLRNVLRATTACTFWMSQLPKVFRTWCVLALWLRNVLRATTAFTFPHHNFQKCSDNEVLLAFWLRHVLRATTACICSSLILPRWLRTRRFSEPTFPPSGATKHWKNTVLRDFSTFSRTCIFFLLTLSLLWSSFFSLFFFSDSSHLCFFICPYCRKFDF